MVLIFQPAEEKGVGAVQMIEGGALKGVEAIFSMHVSYLHPTGVVASRPGEFLAGCGKFKAYISGKGGHAAAPQDSVDPTLAASASIISLQNLISREADPLDSQVLLHPQINNLSPKCMIPSRMSLHYKYSYYFAMDNRSSGQGKEEFSWLRL